MNKYQELSWKMPDSVRPSLLFYYSEHIMDNYWYLKEVTEQKETYLYSV